MGFGSLWARTGKEVLLGPGGLASTAQRHLGQLRRQLQIPPGWGSAPHIAVAVVATAGIKPLWGTGSSQLDADQG